MAREMRPLKNRMLLNNVQPSFLYENGNTLASSCNMGWDGVEYPIKDILRKGEEWLNSFFCVMGSLRGT